MTDQLFAKFPMLDAAIVNAVAEQFASASGQVDIAQATCALERMLAPEYQTQSPKTQELPDKICVMDPMQSVPHAHSNMSPPVLSHTDGIRHVSDRAPPHYAGSEVDFLLGEFGGLDPEVVRTVYENSGGNTAAAHSKLQEIAGGDHSNAALQTQNHLVAHKRQEFKPSDVSPRDYLIQRFPTVPATTIDNILAEQNHDIDASIARLMTASGPSTGQTAVSTEWFEQHQRDEAFIKTLPEDEFKRKLSSLRMFLMSGAGRQGGAMARVVPAERIAAALHYCNCNLETAKSLLLAGGHEELPPYEYPLATAAVNPGVQELQQRFGDRLDPESLASILNSVDGSIEEAVKMLREAGYEVKADAMPVSSIHVNNVPQHDPWGGARMSSPGARKAARRAAGSPSAPGSPARGSPIPGSPARGAQLRQAAKQHRSVMSRHPGGSAGPGRNDDMRELAPKEYVWWWNSARGIWVAASVECRNARQLAVEYTLRLASGQLIDASRAHLRPRFAVDSVPPPPLLPGDSSPRPGPSVMNPRCSGFTTAPVAAPDLAASFDSSPASSSPIIIDPDRSPLKGENGAPMPEAAVVHGRVDTAMSNLQAQPQIETWEFLDPAEQNSLRVAREVQEEQDRNLALKLAAEMPPDAAALPESDDDDNIGLMTGEAQARATQNLYNRLNQPVKDLIEQIQARKAQREEARVMGNEHVRGQLTFQIQSMEAEKEKMQAEVATRMYRARNRHNREVFTLDLHGQHVDAALQTLSEKLVYAAGNPSPGRTLLIVITGRGKHSTVKNFSKVRDAVGKFLNHPDNQKRFNLMTVMGLGHCIVELFPKDKTPSPLSHTEFLELSNWPSVRPVLTSRGDAPEQTRKIRPMSGMAADNHRVSSNDLRAAIDRPQFGRTDSSVSDALSDPIPEPMSEESPANSPAQRTEPFYGRHYARDGRGDGREHTQGLDGASLSQHSKPRVDCLSPEAKLVQNLLMGIPVQNDSVAHAPPGVATGGVKTCSPRAGLGLTPDAVGAHVLQEAKDHVRSEMAEDTGYLQGSQSRVGTMSDMSSRDHRSRGFAAMESLDAGADTSKRGLSESIPAGGGPEDGSKLHERRGVGGSREEPKQGVSMLSQLFSSHAAGVTSARGVASRGLFMADYDGPVAHAPGHSIEPEICGNDVSAVMVADNGAPSLNVANRERFGEDGGARDVAKEKEPEQKGESLVVRAPGHDPPDSERGREVAQAVPQFVQQPATPEANGDGVATPESSDAGVAPLAAQLAKLYC